MRTGGALVVTLPNARAIVRRVLGLQFAVTGAILNRPSPAYLAHIRHLWSPSEARSFVSAVGYELQSLRAGGLGVGPAWLDRQGFGVRCSSSPPGSARRTPPPFERS